MALRGRLTVTPRADGRGYDFTGPTRFDKLFTGIAAPRPASVPTGERASIESGVTCVGLQSEASSL